MRYSLSLFYSGRDSREAPKSSHLSCLQYNQQQYHLLNWNQDSCCFRSDAVCFLNIHVNILQVELNMVWLLLAGHVLSIGTPGQVFTLSSLAQTLRGVSSIDYPFTKSKNGCYSLKLLVVSNIYRNIYRKCPHVKWNFYNRDLFLWF